MNLILLEATDFTGDGFHEVRLTGRRALHIRTVHRAQRGDLLQVGLSDGPLGHAVVREMDDEAVTLEVRLQGEPPPPIPLTLVLAVPRPKVLNRVIAAAASMGVKRIFLMNAWRVEKSYWNSPRMSPENLRLQATLGLEQAGDTRHPDISLKRFFRRFVEDELPGESAGTLRLIAHPDVSRPCPREIGRPVTLVIGPEGGFIEDEVRLLEEHGFVAVTLGRRVLRVETALAALISRLF